MDVKTGVEEKRIKSTIIRRRAKVEPAPAETPPSEKQAGEKSSEASALSEPTTAAVPSSVVEAGSREAERREGELPVKEIPVGAVELEEKAKPKRVVRKKTKDELEMEMIERAGGLKKVAEIIETAPERLERVFKPEKSSKKRKLPSRKEFKKTELTTPKATKRVLRIEGSVTVSDLAKRMSVKAGEVLKKLIDLGTMATLNQMIDSDTALVIAHDFDYEVENVAFTEAAVLQREGLQEEAVGKVSRPPIVTIMGHVDHGKTSLLDAIRKTQVAAGEAGGITQHIGAYEVTVPPAGRTITFIDTPGHEAFTAMRARGAKVTDLVVLVVAADDGIMPQTIEAIHHAKAAAVPILVAVNKIDKPGADPAKVERGLMEHELISEKLGGQTIILPVSAKTGQGLEELLEMILLQSEVLDLKANPKKKAVGTIIEARLDRGRGPVATVVIQEGTLHQGDIVVAGTVIGKVRTLVDYQGKNITEATPSKPVEVLGLSGVPKAGDQLHATDSDDDARLVTEYRQRKETETRHIAQANPTRLEDLYARAERGEIPELRMIIKGDVQGSVEALREALTKLSTEKVRVTVLHTGVGAISESDVLLAVASRAIIVGFNMRPDIQARALAEREKIQIRSYNIIYEVIDDVKKGMEGLLKPTFEERYLGRAEIRQIFTVSKIGSIAGSFVLDGKILRSASVRVVRDGKSIYEGKISSLKRFKDDAREVANGTECGIGIENFNDLKVGDVIEAFAVDEIAGKL